MYATGPSLTDEALALTHAQPGYRHIAISDYFRTGAPCDFFYACDQKWWTIHRDAVEKWNGCENGWWCAETATKKQWPDLFHIAGEGGQGWSTNQAKVRYGGNSGFQITNLAYLLGIKRMILVGFNMMVTDKQHFFGAHPQGLSRNSSYHSFAGSFGFIHPAKHGVEIIQTAEPTKLNHFPRMTLNEAIDRFSV